MQNPVDIFDFEVIRPIKKISYGEIVYLAKNIKTGRLFSMKVIKKSKLQDRSLYMKYAVIEKEVLMSVKHPFITKLRYSYQSDTMLYLIMDYSCGGDISKHLRKESYFSEERAALYLAEAVLALE